MSTVAQSRLSGTDESGATARNTSRHAWLLMAVVAFLHLVGFGVLFAVVIPAQLTVGEQVFGIGLGLTAYVFGLRHAFDADHIAAIDNTTRKLVAERRPSQGVGLFFSLGHSTIVFAMAALVAFGVQRASILVDENSAQHEMLGLIGATVSGVFLLIIGIANVPVLIGLLRRSRARRAARRGSTPLPDEPEQLIVPQGPLFRIVRPLFAFVTRSWHIYPIGVLFGLGFDTATEVSLLVLAGTGSASGLPWYAIMVLPVLFAAGMSLMDTIDGIVMARAYSWGDKRALFSRRFVVSITAASVVTALVVGAVNLVATWGSRAGLPEPVVAWFESIDMEYVGYGLVALCLVLIAAAWVSSHREGATD